MYVIGKNKLDNIKQACGETCILILIANCHEGLCSSFAEQFSSKIKFKMSWASIIFYGFFQRENFYKYLSASQTVQK